MSRRQAELREAVRAALDKVADLRQRGRWGEARAVLEQVRQRLGPSGPEDFRGDVGQALADLTLVDRLDAARLRASVVVDNHFDHVTAIREYAAAFREAGIGEETEPAEVVAERVRASAVREQLLAAVDDWAFHEGEGRRAWLLAVARAAGPGPWRDRFRDVVVRKDRSALERLAREAKGGELSPQILSRLAVRLRTSGGDAVPLLTAAQRRYPSDFWLTFQLAVALGEANHLAEAIEYYRAASALRPATQAVHGDLGLLLKDKGRLDEAIAEHTLAVEINPNVALAHDNLANDLKDKGRLDDAIAEYNKAIGLNPNSAGAHNNLGVALYKKGRFDEAIAEWRRALGINPKGAGAYRA